MPYTKPNIFCFEIHSPLIRPLIISGFCILLILFVHVIVIASRSPLIDNGASFSIERHRAVIFSYTFLLLIRKTSHTDARCLFFLAIVICLGYLSMRRCCLWRDASLKDRKLPFSFLFVLTNTKTYR